MPLIICLNMMDVAKSRGISIDIPQLSQLIGAQVVPTVARSGKGVKSLLEAAVSLSQGSPSWNPLKVRFGRDVDEAIHDVEDLVRNGEGIRDHGYPFHWVAIKMVEGRPTGIGLPKK